MFDKLIKNIERKLGLSIGEIHQLNPIEISQKIEQNTGKQLSFSSEFLYIGRGNVLRDGLLEHNQINSDIDKILGINKCLVS